MSDDKRISDELREWAAAQCNSLALYALADRIDAEMVKLPRDADGNPIMVGDTLFDSHGRKYLVTCILSNNEDCDFAFYADHNNKIAYYPNAFRHDYRGSDSLERIAKDIEDFAEDFRTSDMNTFNKLLDFSGRIQEQEEGGERR